MNQLKFTLLLFGIMWLSRPDSIAQPDIKANDKAIAYLKKFRGEYTKAMRENKPELIQPFYSEQVRLMPAFQKTVIGKSNSDVYYKAFAKRFSINDFSRTEIEILDLGQQVLEIGRFTIRITMKEGGVQHDLAGSYLNLWEELNNGELSLITEAWNYSTYYGEIHDHLKFEDVPAIHAALLPNVIVNSSVSFELAALNRLLDATVTQHDANVWSQYYAADAILIPGYHPPRKGKKEIDEYIQMHAKELPVFEELDIRNDRIDNLGTFVIEYASHIASWRVGNSSGVNMGKNIRIWKRESDHSLKLFRSIGMYD